MLNNPFALVTIGRWAPVGGTDQAINKFEGNARISRTPKGRRLRRGTLRTFFRIKISVAKATLLPRIKKLAQIYRKYLCLKETYFENVENGASKGGIAGRAIKNRLIITVCPGKKRVYEPLFVRARVARAYAC